MWSSCPLMKNELLFLLKENPGPGWKLSGKLGPEGKIWWTPVFFFFIEISTPDTRENSGYEVIPHPLFTLSRQSWQYRPFVLTCFFWEFLTSLFLSSLTYIYIYIQLFHHSHGLRLYQLYTYVMYMFQAHVSLSLTFSNLL